MPFFILKTASSNLGHGGHSYVMYGVSSLVSFDHKPGNGQVIYM